MRAITLLTTLYCPPCRNPIYCIKHLEIRPLQHHNCSPATFSVHLGSNKRRTNWLASLLIFSIQSGLTLITRRIPDRFQPSIISQNKNFLFSCSEFMFESHITVQSRPEFLPLRLSNVLTGDHNYAIRNLLLRWLFMLRSYIWGVWSLKFLFLYLPWML